MTAAARYVETVVRETHGVAVREVDGFKSERVLRPVADNRVMWGTSAVFDAVALRSAIELAAAGQPVTDARLAACDEIRLLDRSVLILNHLDHNPPSEPLDPWHPLSAFKYEVTAAAPKARWTRRGRIRQATVTIGNQAIVPHRRYVTADLLAALDVIGR